HEGEVHDEIATAETGHASEPRFATASGDVEVVGILQDGQLWLYVARFATNAPWPGLSIEIERDAGAVRAEPVAAGVYRVAVGDLERPGRHAFVMSLQGEGLDELLTAQLVVADVPGEQPALPRQQMSAGLAVLAAAVGVHLLHGWRVRRRIRKESRQ
ncbi:MAG TPA: hypothetical protein VIR60_00035, partial [Gammaproteobacteria bacterium]